MGSRRYPDFLQFQTRTPQTLASGQVLENWTNAFTRWGRVQQTNASESTGQQTYSKAEAYSVAVPSDPQAAAIDSQTSRIIWTDNYGKQRTLNINGVDTSQQGRRPDLVFSADLNG